MFTMDSICSDSVTDQIEIKAQTFAMEKGGTDSRLFSLMSKRSHLISDFAPSEGVYF